MINEYGVLKRNCIFDMLSDNIYKDIRSHLKSDGVDLSIKDLMVLERHFHGIVSGCFADYILRRQVELKKQHKPY